MLLDSLFVTEYYLCINTYYSALLLLLDDPAIHQIFGRDELWRFWPSPVNGLGYIFLVPIRI